MIKIFGYLMLGSSGVIPVNDSLDPRFEFLYGLLKDNFSSYSSYIVATTSAILLILGWFLTSKDAQAFVSRERASKIWMLLVIALFMMAEIWLSWNAAYKSGIVKNMLDATAKSDNDRWFVNECYKLNQVRLKAALAFDVLHLALYCALSRVIWLAPLNFAFRGKGDQVDVAND